MIKVATGYYIPATNITFIGATPTLSIRQKIKYLIKEHRFIDLSKGKKIKSIIFYSSIDGEHGIYSPFACETIITKYNEEMIKIRNNIGIKGKDDLDEK